MLGPVFAIWLVLVLVNTIFFGYEILLAAIVGFAIGGIIALMDFRKD